MKNIIAAGLLFCSLIGAVNAKTFNMPRIQRALISGSSNPEIVCQILTNHSNSISQLVTVERYWSHNGAETLVRVKSNKRIEIKDFFGVIELTESRKIITKIECTEE